MPTKVILDTDIGYCTDPDDAIALAYLLLRDDCDLLGVTTVGKLSPQRAELAEVICTQLGRGDLPIHAGAHHPMCATPYWRTNPVQPWPTDAQPRPQRTYPPGRAVPWLIETIRRHPGEITLITIGQFTNLATLLLCDPDSAAMLARVVSMGGRLNYPREHPETECNVMLDPVATAVCVQRVQTPFALLTVDRIHGMDLDRDMLGEMLAGDRLAAVRATGERWAQARGTTAVGLADPFTVAMAFERDVATYRRGRVGVRLSHQFLANGSPMAGDDLTGYTTFAPDPQGPHEIVDTADKAATHRHLLDVFRSARTR